MKLEQTLITSAVNKLEDVYEVHVADEAPSSHENDCPNCEQWFCNINAAINSCKCYNEKVKLLTILPDIFSKKELQGKIPEVSKYLIDKSRKLQREKGIYAQLDPYIGHALSKEVLDVALSFYLDDSKDCTKNSPNKNDVICIKNEDGEMIKKVKRFMTRSIKETYYLMKRENSSLKIGLSKFYSLRPKFVKIQPIQSVCCCIYCSNIKLICIALKNLTNAQTKEEDLLLKCLCKKTNKTNCWLEECGQCPGTEALTIEAFCLDEDEEVVYAIWEGSDLIRKSVPMTKFIEDMRQWVKKGISHTYIRTVQREAIAEIKSVKNHSSLIMHFDFAENWTVILPNEVQSYHWQNIQISLFTCIVYLPDETKSFVVVCDDIIHDTAHALCAIEAIKKELFKCYQLASIKSLVYISDGAAAHFKNKYQFHELSQNCEVEVRKWVFSATGHGKSACDAIGGLSKHYATKFNLQRESTEAIRDSASFVTKISSLVKNITLLNLECKTLHAYRTNKVVEWANVRSIVGIRSKHYWSFKKNEAYIGRTVKHQIEKVETSNLVKEQYSINNLQVGEFIGCVYDNNWWMGQITSISKELKDITVSFMHPHGPAKGFQWPEQSGKKKDECVIPLENVLLKVKHPSPIGRSGRLHTFDSQELKIIHHTFSS